MTNPQGQSATGLAAGTRIGKYEVREKLGAGGMSVVYKCYDATLARFVAAKQIAPHLAENRQFLERFRREAQILAQLGAQQPAVVTIHDLVEDENGLFIVMEYVDGPTLERMLGDSGEPMAPRAAVQLLWRLAGGMAAVHAAGIVHRDLKPSNIIVSEGLRPKITDFGVAASLSGQTSMLMGTTKYMAPELFGEGSVDGRTDMYSLGMILYEALLGRTAFGEVFADIVRDPRTATVRWMKWHGNESVSAPPLASINGAIPRPLSEIISRMIAKRPEDRFESMEQLGREIRSRLAGLELPATGGTAPPIRPRPAPAVDEPAPGGPPGLAVELHEDLPTAPLPKRKLSRSTRIILTAGIAVFVLGGLLTGVMIKQKRQQDRANQAAALFKDGKNAYDAEDFDRAAEIFARVVRDYPGADAAHRSSVLEPMAKARVAIEGGNWDTASQLTVLAKEQADQVQGATDDPQLAQWIKTIRLEIEALNKYRMDRQDFEAMLERARKLAEEGEFDLSVKELEQGASNMDLPPSLDRLLQDLRREILAMQFEHDYGQKVEQMAQAIQRGRGSEADRLHEDMQSALTVAEEDGVVGSDRILELRTGLQKQYDKMLNARQIAEITGRINAAAEAGRAEQERTARQELQSIVPSEENQARIDELTCQIMFAQAEHLRTDGQVDAAREVLVKILILDADFAAAKKALDQIESDVTYQNDLAAAEAAYREGTWAQARGLYEGLLRRRPDEPLLQRRLVECRFNEQLQALDVRRDQAVTAGDLGAMKDLIVEYKRLVEVDPTRRQTDLDPRVVELQRVLDRSQAIAEGDSLLNEGQWTEAIDAYKRALRKSVSAEEVNQVEQLITEAEYQRFLTMGKEALSEGRYPAAKAYLLRAQERRNTVEIRDLLRTVETYLAQEDPD